MLDKKQWNLFDKTIDMLLYLLNILSSRQALQRSLEKYHIEKIQYLQLKTNNLCIVEGNSISVELVEVCRSGENYFLRALCVAAGSQSMEMQIEWLLDDQPTAHTSWVHFLHFI